MSGQEIGVVDAHEDDEAWDDMAEGESGGGDEGPMTPSSSSAQDEGSGKN